MAVLLTVELANKLIDHYEKCIAEVKKCETLSSALDVCNDFKTRGGLCYCAEWVFDYNIYRCGYVKSKTITGASGVCGFGFLGRTPTYAVDVADVIVCLLLRVDFLKQFKTSEHAYTNPK